MRMDVSKLTYEEFIGVCEQLTTKAFAVVREGEKTFLEVIPSATSFYSDAVCSSC